MSVTVAILENRIARASDADNSLFMKRYRELEEFSDRYIKEMTTHGFYPPEYPWPIDNLRDWSRWWEYTFAWLHLKPLFQKQKQVSVLDIGSALTFFPAFLVDRGAMVVSVDIDPRMGWWRDRARRGLSVLGNRRNSFHVLTADVCRLPLASQTFDAVTNISVVEHVAKKWDAIRELQRVLTPGGILVNTTDISLDGLPIGDSMPLDVREFDAFHRLLEDVFKTFIPIGFTHPRDILTPVNYPREITDHAVYVPSTSTSRPGQQALYFWHRYLRRATKLLRSRIFLSPYWNIPLRLLQLVFNPRRFEMWTVMGVSVGKSR